MSFFTRIKIWFLNLRKQKVDGYICTYEGSVREPDHNTEVIKRYGVLAIRFTIPWLDAKNHWVDCYFIPKQAQEDLFFLTKLIRNIPMTAIFKRRKMIGFPKPMYDVIELWSSTCYKEIKNELFVEANEMDEALTLQEEERAIEVARKHAEKVAKKEAAKEAKRLEREKIKEAKLLEKQLEKEAKKLGISVEKLKKQKGIVDDKKEEDGKEKDK